VHESQLLLCIACCAWQLCRREYWTPMKWHVSAWWSCAGQLCRTLLCTPIMLCLVCLPCLHRQMNVMPAWTSSVTDDVLVAQECLDFSWGPVNCCTGSQIVWLLTVYHAADVQLSKLCRKWGWPTSPGIDMHSVHMFSARVLHA
jgi:hypothetical protein